MKNNRKGYSLRGSAFNIFCFFFFIFWAFFLLGPISIYNQQFFFSGIHFLFKKIKQNNQVEKNKKKKNK